jgi:hypothetical protein
VEAEACLPGYSGQLRAGQTHGILTFCGAGHGRALRETSATQVTWAIDGGLEERCGGQSRRPGLRAARIRPARGR